MNITRSLLVSPRRNYIFTEWKPQISHQPLLFSSFLSTRVRQNLLTFTLTGASSPFKYCTRHNIAANNKPIWHHPSQKNYANFRRKINLTFETFLTHWRWYRTVLSIAYNSTKPWQALSSSICYYYYYYL